MTATLILWGHALAALLFVAVALGLRERGSTDLPRGPLIAALALTALWALAVAGIDGQDVSVRAIVGVRDVAWLTVMLALARRTSRPDRAVVALFGVAMAVALLAGTVAIVEAALPADFVLAAGLADTRLCLRALGLLAALLLVHRMRWTTAASVRVLAGALGLMWGGDLLLFAAGQATRTWPAELIAVRGASMALVALLVGVAAGQGTDQPLAVSRAAAVRLISILALAAYAGLVGLLTTVADAVGGDHARLAQTAIVFGATAALLTLLSTPWLRAWGKVMLAKHLFSHRYDYRAEWQRFGGTLASPPGAGAPLGERVAQAIADLTVSPAALLLAAENGTLATTASWRWADLPPLDDAGPLASHLAGGRIVELDAVRAGVAPAGEIAAVPASLLAAADAWAIVPLAHRGGLVGAVVLARPPVDRALDWEDFDLLRVAGRQAAEALAEDRARRALADAERFDEFNRRFAFILHDIKNLVSQLGLVARNAERHADNPAFRADMVATLTESCGRMQALLARLSPHAARSEPPRPVEVAALFGTVAARRRRGHPIACEAASGVWAMADRAGLEMVLDHLVQNAIDASAPDRAITLSACATDGMVAITVADLGTGMSAAFLREQLFRPFVSTKPAGFGLGAYEARQLVEGMGGHLDVASREGEGTRMTIRLPVAHALEIAA